MLRGVMGALGLIDNEVAFETVLAYATLMENRPDNLTPSMVGRLTVCF